MLSRINKIFGGYSYANLFTKQPKTETIVRCNETLRSNESLNFKIYRASGGYILEFSSYDHKRDESIHNLHIINEEQDVDKAIAQIITVELLRT